MVMNKGGYFFRPKRGSASEYLVPLPFHPYTLFVG
jgi:hypothetical protein